MSLITRRDTLHGEARLRPWLAVLIAVGCMTSTGCGARTTTVIPPDELPFAALTESREELLARVAGLQSEVSVLIGAEVIYSATALGETTRDDWDDVDGMIRVDRPDHVRMRGQYNIPLNSVILFDMVSDGEEFRVSLPLEDQFITGANDSILCTDNPLHNLRPHHIVEALFVDISEYSVDPNIVNTLEEVAEDRRSFYVMYFSDVGRAPSQLLEKIWIDRRDLNIVRRQLFGEEGVLRTDVTYADWEERDGSWFPRQLVVERPMEDYRMRIQFERLSLNSEPPSESAFFLPRPVGSELITVESAGASCSAEDVTALN